MLSEEVHNENFSKNTEDSFEAALNSQPLVDSTSARKSSRPNAASTSASNYDGSRGGTNDESDNVENDGRDVRKQ